MKKTVCIALALITTAIAAGCGDVSTDSTVSSQETVVENTKETEIPETTALASEEALEKEYLVTKKFNSPALNNLIGQTTEKEIYAYLPPSYYDSDKNYPVVYYLHGYGEDPTQFLYSSVNQLDEAFANGSSEFILICTHGRNFYANSPVTGNWQDYIAQDVVAFVDENFRTINDKDSRGICGFSMGGYGAYSIGLKHPDIFNSVLAMSPGLFADGDLPAVYESWTNNTGLLKSYAQTFSPNLEDTENYGNIPEFSGTPEDDKIVEDWKNGYGNINQKLDAYMELNNPLKSIKVVYGTNDDYAWIPPGCEFLAAGLEERKINYSIDSFEGRHFIPSDAVSSYLIPFFNENLNYK